MKSVHVSFASGSPSRGATDVLSPMTSSVTPWRTLLSALPSFSSALIRMGVQVDEAGRHDQSARVDLALRRRVRQAPDGDDAIAAHADIARKPRIAGAVDNVAVANQQVVRRLLPCERRLPEESCREKHRQEPAPKHLCHTLL